MHNTIKSLSMLFLMVFALQVQAAKYIEFFCGPEFKKLCQDSPGAFQCLKKFPKERSATCDAAFKAYEKEQNYFFGPCLNEKANTCKDLEPGMGLIQPCLEGIVGKVSAACEKHIKLPTAARFPDLPFESQIICGNELKTHCAKVTYGDRRFSSCLRFHYSKIAPGKCKELVQQLL